MHKRLKEYFCTVHKPFLIFRTDETASEAGPDTPATAG